VAWQRERRLRFNEVGIACLVVYIRWLVGYIGMVAEILIGSWDIIKGGSRV
jgi:hypothetical protein